MSDIFISYKREEQDKARQLAVALEQQGWSVWWDPKLRAGEYFNEVIQKALDEARCVIVLWSKRSVKSRYVTAESSYALEYNKLVPVAIEDVELPFLFRSIHTPRLIDWDVSDEFDAFKSLVDDIAAKLGKPIKAKLKQAESIGAKTDSQPAAAKVKPSKPARTQLRQARPVGATEGNRSTAKVFQDTLKDGAKGPEMVLIEGGALLMGSDPNVDSNESEQPQHNVTIEPFYIGKYPVTFAEYAVFAQITGRRQPPDDGGWGRDRRPVINVSWKDATAYCDWLSEQTGKRYSLPSEAKWEHAARAGIRSRWYWGDNEENAGDCAWFESNANRTQPVGGKQPNDFGLYDMAGNVWEWVQDCWHGDYSNAPDDGRAWLKEDGGDCARRVVRGGSWHGLANYLRSAYRFWYYSHAHGFDRVGFRVVCRPHLSPPGRRFMLEDKGDVN